MIYNLPQLVVYFSFKSSVLHCLYLPHDLISLSRVFGKPTSLVERLLLGQDGGHSAIAEVVRQQVLIVDGGVKVRHPALVLQHLGHSDLGLQLSSKLWPVVGHGVVVVEEAAVHQLGHGDGSDGLGGTEDALERVSMVVWITLS